MLRSILLPAWLWLIFCLSAAAHPVAQGTMDIALRPNGLEVRALVSNEEIFVGEAFGGHSGKVESLAELRKRHGDYLLSHLHFTADGESLAGRVVGWTPSKTTSPDDRVLYALEFPFSPEDLRPSRVCLKQDVLNEFEFAPGNPWEATYIVRVTQEGRPVREGLLSTRTQEVSVPCDWTVHPVAVSAARVDWPNMGWAFVRHGMEHIIAGWDHLLFIASLVLAITTFWDLFKIVSVFTVSHTITLTLSVLNIVRLPNRIVEPMIAASIVFIALQNVIAPQSTRHHTRLAVVFGFGLFHGLGFAGGLARAMEGMSGVVVAVGIVGFSLGVEIGHQCVALPLFGTMRAMETGASNPVAGRKFASWVARVVSGLISCAGAIYLIAALRAP